MCADVPKSAMCKADRHFLGIAALWFVQVGVEIYRFFSFKLLGKKVTGSTVKCGASLVFASIAVGIGATLFYPSARQWIGGYISSSTSTL
ncbi:hypothetical protein AAG906_010208 [Vitis piasezkii]